MFLSIKGMLTTSYCFTKPHAFLITHTNRNVGFCLSKNLSLRFSSLFPLVSLCCASKSSNSTMRDIELAILNIQE